MAALLGLESYENFGIVPDLLETLECIPSLDRCYGANMHAKVAMLQGICGI